MHPSTRPLIIVAGALFFACQGPRPEASSTAPLALGGSCKPIKCSGDDCDRFNETSEFLYSKEDTLSVPQNVVMPPRPLIPRAVRLAPDPPPPGGQGRYLRPVVPAWRTSTDGRLAFVAGKTDDGKATASVRPIMLENLAHAAVSQQGNELGETIFGQGIMLDPDVVQDPDGSFVCQKTPNPRKCDATTDDDCYDLTLVFRDKGTDGDGDFTVLRAVSTLVRVTEPKTIRARVKEVTPDPKGKWTVSARLPFSSTGEMVSTFDGKMVVARLHTGGDDGGLESLSYTLDNGDEKTNDVSIVYAYSDSPCDVLGWTKRRPTDNAFIAMRPIPAAPFDSRLRDGPNGPPRYGLAARKIRDAYGREMGEAEVLMGSYPWLDRGGNNLFFSTVDPTPFSGNLQSARFHTQREGGDLGQVKSAPRGFAVVGSWTQGKTVMLDGLLNNDDYGFDPNDTHQLRLYDAKGGKFFAARVNGGGNVGMNSLQMTDANTNNDEIESLENNVAMHLGNAPVTPRDVVWNVSRGLASDEVAFDEMLNPNLVLLAEMNATWDPLAKTVGGTLRDGFTLNANQFQFDAQDIRIQNSATSPSNIVPLASPGVVEGNARIEPVALGGVRGRGMWLGPKDRMRFAFPKEMTAAAKNKGFYVSLFVDARDDLAGSRHLFSLESTGGTPLSALLVDGEVLQLRRGADQPTVNISCQVQSWAKRWHHVGVLFDGNQATVFLDGNPIDSVHMVNAVALAEGSLTVGGSPPSAAVETGIAGWYDEVRVELNGTGAALTHAASVETLCNAARGTTVGVKAGSPLEDLARIETYARTRATAVHAQWPNDAGLLMCATDYSGDLAIGRNKLPAKTTAVRDDILLEGTTPLVWNQPRPASDKRSFCLSCHVDAKDDPNRAPGLMLDALFLHPGVKLVDDPRTQPLQPPSHEDGPAVARGRAPQNWLTATDGSMQPPDATDGPGPILKWVFR